MHTVGLFSLLNQSMSTVHSLQSIYMSGLDSAALPIGINMYFHKITYEIKISISIQNENLI